MKIKSVRWLAKLMCLIFIMMQSFVSGHVNAAENAFLQETGIEHGDLTYKYSWTNQSLTDFKTSTIEASSLTQDLQGIAYDPEGGYYIAVGANGVVFKSSDLRYWDWIQVKSSDGTLWSSKTLNGIVCYGHNKFLAAGDAGSVIRTEDGGLTWDLSLVSGTGSKIVSVAYHEGIFVFSVELGQRAISFNGTTFTSLYNEFPNQNFRDVAWSSLAKRNDGSTGMFGITGGNYPNGQTGIIMVSYTGESFYIPGTTVKNGGETNIDKVTPRDVPGTNTTTNLNSITFIKDRWVTAGGGRIVYQQDAQATAQKHDPRGEWPSKSFTSIKGDYHCLATNTEAILTDKDTSNDSNIRSAAGGVNADGTARITTSLDAKAFNTDATITSEDPSVKTKTIRRMIWDGTRFVGVGLGGTVVASSAGDDWRTNWTAFKTYVPPITSVFTAIDMTSDRNGNYVMVGRALPDNKGYVYEGKRNGNTINGIKILYIH